ncbi:hypothetical protein A0E43_19210 [Pectobacterium cacticida]
MASIFVVFVGHGLAGIKEARILRQRPIHATTPSGLVIASKMKEISVAEALARAIRNVPSGRLAQPEEVANLVLFLAFSCASYVTGVLLTMDGAAAPIVI